MSKHARLAPSAAERWIPCPGSLAMEELCPQQNEDNDYSREGTAAHELASWALETNNRCEVYVGATATNGWEITQDMADDTQIYVDKVLQYAEGNKLFIEQRLSIEHITGEEGAAGTSDAVVITDDLQEIMVIDLKFGRGIKVDAQENKQLMMYALAALEQYNMIGDFKRVRLIISQPRLGHLSEWDCTVEDLLEFGENAKVSATVALAIADGDRAIGPTEYLSPGEKTCQWCRAKATCPALSKFISDTVGEDFLDLTIINDVTKLVPADPGLLADKMNAIDMIETWCKAIRAEVERYLLQGHEVPGYKIVQGKMGNRKWSDEKIVEEVMKKMRLKLEEMYSFNLISPTTAEKLFKANPRQWKKLTDLITRSEGKPSVAAASDPRPAMAIQPISEDFDDVQPGSEFA